MYYKILLKQYLREAEILRNYLKKLKLQYKGRPSDLDLYYRIKILYGMYLDLRYGAEGLKYKCEVMATNGK